MSEEAPINKAAAQAEAKKTRFSIEERLVKGEHIISSARISDGIFWKAGVVFVFALLVALLLAKELGLVLAVAAVAMGIQAVLMKEVLLLIVTNKRIFARYGILQVDVVDIHFDKIESIELDRMLPGYVLGYSNVIIMGTGNRFIMIPYVANGVDIRRAYNEQTLGQAGGEE